MKRLPLLFAIVVVLVVGWSAPGEAQGRRAGGGRSGAVAGGGRSAPAAGGYRGGYRGSYRPIYYGGYYGGFYGRSFYFADPFWYGYPWYPYQYPIGGYPYPYGYGYRWAQPDSAVRLDVKPNDADVFVDGYYAGIVDDFDGVLQRLRVPPGQHEIILYKDGYRAVHETAYLTADSTFKFHYTMEKLAPGDVAEPRPTPKEPPPDAAPQDGQNPNGPDQPGPPRFPRGGPGTRRQPPPYPPNPGEVRGGENSAFGTLAIRVQPGNANVTIDGEKWEAPQGQDRLIVQLPEGPHRVQIQSDGFEPFSNEIMIRRGETTPLNVSLRTR